MMNLLAESSGEDLSKLGLSFGIAFASIELLKAVLVPLARKLVPTKQQREDDAAPPRWAVERDRDEMLRDIVATQQKIVDSQQHIVTTLQQITESQRLTALLLQELAGKCAAPQLHGG